MILFVVSLLIALAKLFRIVSDCELEWLNVVAKWLSRGGFDSVWFLLCSNVLEQDMNSDMNTALRVHSDDHYMEVRAECRCLCIHPGFKTDGQKRGTFLKLTFKILQVFTRTLHEWTLITPHPAAHPPLSTVTPHPAAHPPLSTGHVEWVLPLAQVEVNLSRYDYWCLNRHLCILQERFAKKDLNCKFGHCFLQFIGKLSLITNYIWLERGDSQL